jgi:hypothetical protein
MCGDVSVASICEVYVRVRAEDGMSYCTLQFETQNIASATKTGSSISAEIDRMFLFIRFECYTSIYDRRKAKPRNT